MIVTEQHVKLAREEREERRVKRAKREDYFRGQPYEETALQSPFRGHGHYRLRPHADPAELIVIDVVPRNKSVFEGTEKKLLVMKEKQSDSQERITTGFDALEVELIDKAWENAAIYNCNKETQEKMRFALDLLNNIFNVVIVLIVVLKQWWYPNEDNVIQVCSR
eukprot:COSAG02_NODE_16105_length_1113_cov_0.753452_3_plen_164_part_01